MTPGEPRSVLIVGASLAGYSTARALRKQGFDGRVVLVGDELERPYDRPPLSKDYLLGTVSEADLSLEPEGEGLGAEWILGRRAVALDVAGGVVTLAGGEQLSGDAVVVATGSRARTLPGAVPGAMAGVHTVRTLNDARSLRAELLPGARLVVIGAGFIGAEIASTARSRGLNVTVVEAAVIPFGGPLGPQVGAAVAGLHARHDVSMTVGVGVRGLVGKERVTGVELSDGRILDADVVVVGIGALPNVEWLAGSHLAVAQGLLGDSMGRTNAPNVFGVGDCSAWFDVDFDRHHRIEHWTESRDRPAAMVEAILGSHDPAVPPTPLRAPYFWSEQYGVLIQFAGRRHGDERVTFEAGSPEGLDLLAVYWCGDDPVAVLGMNQPRAFTTWRRSLSANPAHQDPVLKSKEFV